MAGSADRRRSPQRSSTPPTSAGEEAFQFTDPTPQPKAVGRKRRRRNNWQVPLVITLMLLGMGAVVGWLALSAQDDGRGPQRTLALQVMDDLEIDGRVPVTFQVGLRATGVSPDELEYSLPESPEGVAINPRTGEISWTPEANRGPGRYPLTVRVIARGAVPLSDERQIALVVREAAAVAEADDDSESFPPFETPAEPEPLAVVTEPPQPVTANETDESAAETPATVAETDDDGDEALLALYKRKRMFLRSEYPALRRMFAERFERQFADQMQAAWGAEYDEFSRWLNERPEIKEEFLTAIDVEHDDVVAALRLFKELWREFPRAFERYAELAIAVAVTWDQDRSGIYDYRGHQVRTKTTLPDELVGAIDNFRSLVEAENAMQGRVQFLPWEFLKHVVNHRTPVDERQWALRNYLPRRTMFGKCYADVPYDDEMLATSSETARLNGQLYTLENILKYGGVCAMQADFATRVGKSLGVPAEYVGGESRSGDLHAWVMWVELRQVTKNNISFSLESHGRYLIDRYYVGTLRDPQTGQPITDRELELRLHTVGLNVQSKRHADLAMRAYPLLRDRIGMEPLEQIQYLDQVIALCPGNEDAWIGLARISRNGGVKRQSFRLMTAAFDKLFQTFAAFPDFTWKVFDDLITFQDDRRQRTNLYQRLVALYERAGRPDLSCEARLKLTDYLVEEGRINDAAQGLAFTIRKFSDEGRYVPRMLDRLEEVSRDQRNAEEQLLAFYRDFLPTIPTVRGDTPSAYCIAMYERGVARFQSAGQTQLAQAFEAQLAQIRAGTLRRR